MTPSSTRVCGLYPAQVNCSKVVSPLVPAIPARIAPNSSPASNPTENCKAAGAFAAPDDTCGPCAETGGRVCASAALEALIASLNPKRWPGTFLLAYNDFSSL